MPPRVIPTARPSFFTFDSTRTWGSGLPTDPRRLPPGQS